MTPDVSVIIPTYNRLTYLRQAIASCIDGNDGIQVQVIVVDDGSTDGTRDWLHTNRDPRLHPVLQEHQGPQVARNRGLSEACGEFVKFLDDDDYLYPRTLAAQYRALRHSNASVVYGHIDLADRDGTPLRHVSSAIVDDLLAGIAAGQVTTYPHVFLYRAACARLARWLPELRYHQDTAFALAIAAANPRVVRVDATVGVHRIHDGTRITTSKRATGSVEKTGTRIDLLLEAYGRRRRHAAVDDALSLDVARGVWQEAHKVAPVDFDRFLMHYGRLIELMPAFRPPRNRRLLRGCDRLLDPRWTERILNPLRKLKGRYARRKASWG